LDQEKPVYLNQVIFLDNNRFLCHTYIKDTHLDLGYQKFDQNVSFSKLAISNSMENKLCLEMMETINQVIDLLNIETLLIKYYDIGTRKDGVDAYPPR